MEKLAHNNNEHPSEEEVTRMLGAHVPEPLYWAFKKAASARKEQLKDAIAHAARMYIDAVPEKRGE